MTAIDRDVLARRAERSLSEEPRAFLRWAGSKRRLLTQLVPHLPLEFGTYWEPFLGSGSLYFLTRPSTARLNDRCAPLIKTYSAVRDGPKAVAMLAESWSVDRDSYHSVRRLLPSNRFEAAARFIYLNKTCWNGLYRVNSRGVFNVPFGRPKSSNIIESRNLVACGRLLKGSDTTLQSADFEDALAGVSAGDLVYLDPPYVTGHNNNGFIDYNESLFTWDDQRRLAALADRLRKRGAYVVVSNALHAEVIGLYETFDVVAASRPSTLAGDIARRTRASEAIFIGGWGGG